MQLAIQNAGDVALGIARKMGIKGHDIVPKVVIVLRI